MSAVQKLCMGPLVCVQTNLVHGRRVYSQLCLPEIEALKFLCCANAVILLSVHLIITALILYFYVTYSTGFMDILKLM